jgi:hypothetical protein
MRIDERQHERGAAQADSSHLRTAVKRIASSILVGAWTVLIGCSLGLPSLPDRPDSGTVDGAVPPNPTGTVSPDGAVLKCPPNTTGFRPTNNFHSPNPARKLCTETQVTELVECLAVLESQPMACNTFKQNSANTTCYNCVVTSSISATYGAVIDDGAYVYPNFAGCLSVLEGNLSTSSCGARVLANDECAGYSCQACADAQSYGPDWGACMDRASAVDCQTYDRSCAAKYEPQCLGQNFKEDLQKVIKVFCGP